MSDTNFPNKKEEDGIEIITLDNKEEDSVNTESSSTSVETNSATVESASTPVENDSAPSNEETPSDKDEKKPLPKNELIRYIILGICIVVFIVSAAILVNYFIRQYKEKKAYKDLESTAVSHQDATTEFVDEESSEYVLNISNQIDFELLSSINEDFRGWVSFPLLGIEYPFVQGPDNDYYLTHSYNGEEAYGGAIYMEATLNPNFQESHVILYGHNMTSIDGSMFSGLLKYDDEKFYNDNKGEHLVYIYLPDNTVRVYEPFSVTDATLIEHEPLFYIRLNSTAEYADYASTIELYDTGIDITDDDQILTLFTCQYGGNNNERHMVHCRLVTVVNNE